MAKKRTAKNAQGRFPKKPTVSTRKDRQPGGFTTPGKVQLPPGRLDKNGRWLWDHLCELLPENVIQSCDASALYGLCKWWQVWRYWEPKCTSADQAKAYKAGTMAGMAWKHVAEGLRKFGLTPLDRAKIKQPEQGQENDAFAQWLEQMGSN